MTATGRRTYAPRVPVEQRRAELLDAALDLVVTEGHDAATMDAVAARVGVSKPVVYGVFANRAELLGTLLRREQEAALAQVAALVPAALDPGRPLGPQLGAVLDDVLAAVRSAPHRWYCVVMPMPGMPADLHVAREHGRAVLLAGIGRHVRAWLAATGAPAEVAPGVVAHAVLALVETAIRLVLTEPDRYRPELIIATVVALLSPGAGTPPRSEPRTSP